MRVTHWKIPNRHENNFTKREKISISNFRNRLLIFENRTHFSSPQASEALQGLLTEETTGSGGVSDTQLIDNVWRPAEAYHFYILAQRQFKSNNSEGALRSALTLTEYEDIIPVQTIYNLIGKYICLFNFTFVKVTFWFPSSRHKSLLFSCLALCATSCGAFSTASKAFLKLEDDPSINDEDRKEYQKLAFQIFLRYFHSPSHFITNDLIFVFFFIAFFSSSSFLFFSFACAYIAIYHFKWNSNTNSHWMLKSIGKIRQPNVDTQY